LKEHIIIGTRGSDLALWQARFVQEELSKLGIKSDLKIISTQGDRVQDLNFSKMEGKGFFTKEIEESLLNGEIDMAVHSMKDLPTASTSGLTIGGVSLRENPCDVLLIRQEIYKEGNPLGLGEGSTIGTSSNRRKALIQYLWPNINHKDLRGNVPTRVQKLREGHFDAIILAKAGLSRLGLDLTGLVAKELHPREFIPAPAQGVLAFQCRDEDAETLAVLRKIHQGITIETTNVERKILKILDGGCQLPVGAYCERDLLNNYHVWACYTPSLDMPLRVVKVSLSTSAGLAEEVVQKLKDESKS